jgi:hypothetical protein
LTEDNFLDYISEQGTFDKTSKLYVCENNSPEGSPGGKKADVGKGSQSSRNSKSHRAQTLDHRFQSKYTVIYVVLIYYKLVNPNSVQPWY